ncbi:hypothetical protein IFM89_011481 [Coptis chinensis]|uniref:PHD and RING finger domain-containing protein 1 n=1 Tax=Coptis chinensis TaxID=261450 RepID=A0A835M9E4_9MAGN|nr:hypothetical protein IFM89_011481 [Coptis chinensis]
MEEEEGNTNPDALSSSKKGKEKISEPEVCGICFSEEEKTIRGWIDSCNHYFCYLCIMEWAKLESRCPMCKQRFKEIVRKAKHAVFINERVVNVPLRNQTSQIYDPYEQVNCSQCHSSSDENLLLLCDLCDSAAHTYCVGLGATVPEGDWFCHDCTVSRNAQQADSESDKDPVDSDSNVSISEIVRESCTGNVKRSRGKRKRLPTRPARVPDRDRILKAGKTKSSVRTLRHCRNVHSRIRVMRENWNALRNESVYFSRNRNVPNSVGKNDKKQNDRPAVIYAQWKEPVSSSSNNCTQNSTVDSSTGERLKNAGSQDIDKAWKMLDIAKSVQRAREATQRVNQNSSHQLCKQEPPKEEKNTSSTISMPKRSTFQQQDLGVVAPENYRHQLLEIAQRKRKSQNCEEGRPSRDACHRRLSSSHPSQSFEVPLARKPHLVDAVDLFHEQNWDVIGASSDVNERSGNTWSISQTEPSCRVSDLTSKRSKFCPSSCSEEEIPNKGTVVKSCANIMVSKDKGAKCEVQSLVKLNLKLLSKDKRLVGEGLDFSELNLFIIKCVASVGVDGFKEVARLATHTVLAACGLEHKKSIVRPFPDSVCRHNNQTKQLHMSNLMPSSCRECFYAFVKDTVKAVLSEQKF